mmetsp:Transcript_5080/g.9228  ORF Transcript_5080/g.9228 Transcript_5080/m.9228 type:complete len:205 (+) Transcript_5080:771-1385(+)
MWDWLVCCRGDAALAVGEPQSTVAEELSLRNAQAGPASAVSEEVVTSRAGPSRSGSGGSGSNLSTVSRVSSTSKGKMKAQPPPVSPVLSGCNVPISMRPSSSSDTASTSYAESPSIPDPILEENGGDNNDSFVGVHAAYVPLDPSCVCVCVCVCAGSRLIPCPDLVAALHDGPTESAGEGGEHEKEASPAESTAGAVGAGDRAQ